MRDQSAKRLGDLIRRLSSPHDGEIIAAVHALKRTLKNDFHAIAKLVESGDALSEAEMRKLYDAGFQAGLAEAESRHDIVTTNVDAPEGLEMAQWCEERSHRLARQHRGFIKGMCELCREHEPTLKQRVYLRSLFRQLGGE